LLLTFVSVPVLVIEIVLTLIGASAKGLGIGGIIAAIFGLTCIFGVSLTFGVVEYGVNQPHAIAQNGGALPAGGLVLLNKQGRLMPNDPQKEFKPHKPFTVRLAQGKTYVIDLQSREMDSYLFLYDHNGIRVAEDDDSGGNLDARIRFTPNRTGNYLVSASVLGGVGPAGANFTLTVREQ
jgi:hypothetical protein